MPLAPPRPAQMFADVESRGQIAEQFELYKGLLDESHAHGRETQAGWAPGQGIVPFAGKGAQIDDAFGEITKGLNPGADVERHMALLRSVTADIGKDWSVTSPNAQGLVAYDLEAPAKILVPKITPLRNLISRVPGVGTARQFKRILGWTNSGIGGVADQSTFFNSESASNSFGGLSLRRPAKISYASDSQTVAYVEQGASDSVTWKAEFAGQGYQSIRQLSQTALLWATMGGEERNLLYGRGSSGNGYAGTVAAPAASATGSTTGGTIAAGTYTAVITAKTGYGETAVSGTLSTTTTGATSSIAYTVTSEPVGSLGVYNLYVSQAGGAVGTATFQQSFVGTTVTLTTPPTSTGAVNAGATNTSADPNSYDGFMTVLAGPNSGYFKRLNSTLSNANPGAEWQDAFASLYGSVKADPDNVWAAAGVVRALGDLLKTSSSSNYRLVMQADGTGHMLGSSVNGVENQITTKMLDLRVHPWMPAGCSMIHSVTLPFADSEVGDTSQVVNVQDYMAVEWPVVAMTYDASTYLFGTLVHYAPAWSGLITNILT